MGWRGRCLGDRRPEQRRIPSARKCSTQEPPVVEPGQGGHSDPGRNFPGKGKCRRLRFTRVLAGLTGSFHLGIPAARAKKSLLERDAFH
jgi:hypothetical protein